MEKVNTTPHEIIVILRKVLTFFVRTYILSIKMKKEGAAEHVIYSATPSFILIVIIQP